MPLSPIEIDIPCDYEVIGEHLVDPTKLLVWADDRRFYALHLSDGHIEPTELHEHWVVDTCDLGEKLTRTNLN
jgi:hypothetical protein